MSSRDFVELRSQALADAHRQERGAVVVSFAATRQDLVALEVNVFDSQRQAFEQPEAAAIEHLRDQAEGRLERLQMAWISLRERTAGRCTGRREQASPG